jgi:hypothetical protein
MQMRAILLAMGSRWNGMRIAQVQAFPRGFAEWGERWIKRSLVQTSAIDSACADYISAMRKHRRVD